jgi:hypothetical protein
VNSKWSVLLSDKCTCVQRRIPKGKSRMDNPETLVTLGIQHTGRRQTSTKTQRVILLQSTEEEYIIVSNGPYKRHRGQYFYTVQQIGGEFTIWNERISNITIRHKLK